MKYVGEVIDPEYWKAWEESDILEVIRAVQKDAVEIGFKKLGWTKDV